MNTNYEVQRILSRRTAIRNGSQVQQYLVKWRNFSSSENTWEPLDHLHDCGHAIKQFNNQYYMEDEQFEEQAKNDQKNESDEEFDLDQYKRDETKKRGSGLKNSRVVGDNSSVVRRGRPKKGEIRTKQFNSKVFNIPKNGSQHNTYDNYSNISVNKIIKNQTTTQDEPKKLMNNQNYQQVLLSNKNQKQKPTNSVQNNFSLKARKKIAQELNHRQSQFVDQAPVNKKYQNSHPNNIMKSAPKPIEGQDPVSSTIFPKVKETSSFNKEQFLVEAIYNNTKSQEIVYLINKNGQKMYKNRKWIIQKNSPALAEFYEKLIRFKE